MAASQSGPKRRWFSRRSVEERFVAPEPIEEETPMEDPVLPEQVTAALGSHVAQLLSRFEEVVEVAKQEAAAEATRVLQQSEVRAAEAEEDVRELMAKGRDLAASTFAEAERRYEEAVAAKDVAVRRIGEAIDQLRSALASLEAIPPFPVLEVPVPTVDEAGEPVPFRTVTPVVAAAAVPAVAAVHLDDEDDLGWPSDDLGDLGDLVAPVPPTPVDEPESFGHESFESEPFESLAGTPLPLDEADDEPMVAAPVSSPAMSAADELQQLLRDLGGSAS